MAQKISLRDYQRELAERLRLADSARSPSKLGLEIGTESWLVDLAEAGEVIPVPPITPVPLTRPWFRGVVNVRGNLYSVIDFAGYLGHGNVAPASSNRLVLFGARAGELNAGIVVSRVTGLRNLAELAPAAAPEDARPWYTQRWIDAEGGAWQEIDLARLAREPSFLQVGA